MQNVAKPKFLAVWFLLCALPTGLGSALLTPVGFFPDEFAHIVRADGLRYGQVYGMRPPPGFPPMTPSAGTPFNTGLFQVVAGQNIELFPVTPAQAAALHQARLAPWGKTSYWPTQMVEYFPVFYSPAALVLLTGEKLGFTPLTTLFLGRLAMLLAFIALGTAALGLARFGGGLLFAVLTLPTTINLASSYNQDGLMTAGCVFAVALLTRCSCRASCAALVMLSCVASTKTPYAPLLLFGLFPLITPGLRWRALGVLLACVPPTLWLLHIMNEGFMPVPSNPYHPGPLWPGARDIWLHDIAPNQNIRVLLAQPVRIFRLPVISLMYYWPITWPLVLAMVNCDHGMIAAWEYPCLAAALCTAALGVAVGRDGGHWADMGLGVPVLFAAFVSMELSLYLTFTPAGALVIAGVQSRYFLPFLPFLVLLLAGRLGLPCIAAGWFCLPALIMAAINAYALPDFLFHLYRVAGP